MVMLVVISSSRRKGHEDEGNCTVVGLFRRSGFEIEMKVLSFTSYGPYSLVK